MDIYVNASTLLPLATAWLAACKTLASKPDRQLYVARGGAPSCGLLIAGNLFFDQTALRQHNFVTRSRAGRRAHLSHRKPPTTTIYEADAGRREPEISPSRSRSITARHSLRSVAT